MIWSAGASSPDGERPRIGVDDPGLEEHPAPGPHLGVVRGQQELIAAGEQCSHGSAYRLGPSQEVGEVAESLLGGGTGIGELGIRGPSGPSESWASDVRGLGDGRGDPVDEIHPLITLGQRAVQGGRELVEHAETDVGGFDAGVAERVDRPELSTDTGNDPKRPQDERLGTVLSIGQIAVQRFQPLGRGSVAE